MPPQILLPSNHKPLFARESELFKQSSMKERIFSKQNMHENTTLTSEKTWLKGCATIKTPFTQPWSTLIWTPLYHLGAPREVVVREHDAPGPRGARLRVLLGRVVDEGAAVVDGEALQAVVQPRLGQVLADVEQLRPREDVLLQ